MLGTRHACARTLSASLLAALCVVTTSGVGEAGVAVGTHVGVADAHAFVHQSPYAPTEWGQDWTHLVGTLQFGGITYDAQFTLQSFACPGDPAVQPCGTHSVALDGSLQPVKAVTTNRRFITDTMFGSCQMPYFPSGAVGISCSVRVAGATLRTYPLVLQIRRLLPEATGRTTPYNSFYVQL